MRQRERVMLRRGPVSPSRVSTGLSRNTKSAAHRSILGVETLLELQRTHGNVFVQRLVQRRVSVSQPGDRYEQEADRVAETVLQGRRPGPKPAISSIAEQESDMTQTMEKGIYGTAPRPPQEEEDSTVMARASANGLRRSHIQIGKALSGSRAIGESLPKSTRRFMESRFGVDFGAVRVHTEDQAIQMTRALNAEAFTSGRDVYFNSGRYRPDSTEGKFLLAHELTHVVQQSRSGRQAESAAGLPSIQRYKLKGFPSDKASRMRSAIASAISTVANCKKLWAYGKVAIIHSLKRLRYDYVPDLGICGWTFPGSWYVEVGKEAFDTNTCCYLSSTLAHEAAHTELYTEGRARKMECKCFGCSC